MDRDIKVIFGVWDEKHQTKHTFSVKLGMKVPKGEDSDDQLTQKIEEAFEECKRKNRLTMLFDGSIQSNYQVERYESPFEIYSSIEDFRDINDSLIEIDYYSKKNNAFFNKLINQNLDFEQMLEKGIKKKYQKD